MENVESALSSKDREALSAEVIIKWSPEQVIAFLKSKSDELYLEDKDIEIIEENRISGRSFLRLDIKELKGIGLKLGPALSIHDLVKTFTGDKEKTLKCKYEESMSDLKRALKELLQEFFQKKPDEISISSLSQSKMRKITNEIGLTTMALNP